GGPARGGGAGASGRSGPPGSRERCHGRPRAAETPREIDQLDTVVGTHATISVTPDGIVMPLPDPLAPTCRPAGPAGLPVAGGLVALVLLPGGVSPRPPCSCSPSGFESAAPGMGREENAG